MKLQSIWDKKRHFAQKSVHSSLSKKRFITDTSFGTPGIISSFYYEYVFELG